jgi:outer membrane protein assembly factor BamB
VVDDLVYLFRENSIFICLDAKSGEKLYEQRVCSSDNNRGSPLFANGHIYLAARNGIVTVVKAGRKFEQVWQTNLEDSMTSSPVIANGRLYLRTNTALWAFGTK